MRFNSNDCREIVNFFKQNDIEAMYVKNDDIDFNTQVLVSTFYSVKGLGFDNIIILNFDASIMNSVKGTLLAKGERDIFATVASLFYVAATRAKDNLIITRIVSNQEEILTKFAKDGTYCDFNQMSNNRPLITKAKTCLDSEFNVIENMSKMIEK